MSDGWESVPRGTPASQWVETALSLLPTLFSTNEVVRLVDAMAGGAVNRDRTRRSLHTLQKFGVVEPITVISKGGIEAVWRDPADPGEGWE